MHLPLFLYLENCLKLWFAAGDGVEVVAEGAKKLYNTVSDGKPRKEREEIILDQTVVDDQWLPWAIRDWWRDDSETLLTYLRSILFVNNYNYVVLL